MAPCALRSFAVTALSVETAKIAAKMLRVLIKRPEDYYAPNAIDTEEYPEEELQKQEHGDA